MGPSLMQTDRPGVYNQRRAGNGLRIEMTSGKTMLSFSLATISYTSATGAQTSL